MSAAYHNQNAKKWTIERVLESLCTIMNYVSDEENVYYIGSVLAHHKLYKEIWSYWRKTYSESEEVQHCMSTIENVLESRLYEAALSGRVSSTIAMICLNSRHRWSARPERDDLPQDEATRWGIDQEGQRIEIPPFSINLPSEPEKPITLNEAHQLAIAATFAHADVRIWPESRVLESVKTILLYTQIPDLYYIGSLLGCQGLYRDVWQQWRYTYAGQEEIGPLMRAIDTILEARLIEAALHRKVRTQMALYGMKRVYSWDNDAYLYGVPNEYRGSVMTSHGAVIPLS